MFTLLLILVVHLLKNKFNNTNYFFSPSRFIKKPAAPKKNRGAANV